MKHLNSIQLVFFPGISHGPCNNWHYLGHVKHVNDDDDDVRWCDTRTKKHKCTHYSSYCVYIWTHLHSGTPEPHWRSAADCSLGTSANKRAAYMWAYWRWKFRCGSTKRSLSLVYFDSARLNVLQSESDISTAIISVLSTPR